jgi:hypothetical protein
VLSYGAGSKTQGEEGKEREIDLAEIVGLPDFDVSHMVSTQHGSNSDGAGSGQGEVDEQGLGVHV